MATRLGLGAIGLVVGVYGGYVGYSRLTHAQDVSVLKWLVGGVVVHDGLIAAASLLAGFFVTRTPRRWVRGPLTVGLIVLATVIVASIPMIGRYGAVPANPTLLDRNYGLGLVVFVVLVAVGVGIGMLVARRREGRRIEGGEAADVTSTGGRRRQDGA